MNLQFPSVLDGAARNERVLGSTGEMLSGVLADRDEGESAGAVQLGGVHAATGLPPLHGRRRTRPRGAASQRHRLAR